MKGGIDNFLTQKIDNKENENIHTSRKDLNNFNKNKNSYYFTPKKSLYEKNHKIRTSDNYVKNHDLDININKNLFLTDNLFSKDFIKMSKNFNYNNSQEFDKIYNNIFCSVKNFTESNKRKFII